MRAGVSQRLMLVLSLAVGVPLLSQQPAAAGVPKPPVRRRRLARPPPERAAARLPLGADRQRLRAGRHRDRPDRADPPEQLSARILPGN